MRGRVPQQVAALARQVADEFGGPQDIEWAADHEGRIWLLQARPITTLRQEASAAPAGAWTRRIAVDLWADQLTPYLADHMLRNAPRFDFSKMARFSGMPVVQPALAVVHGFLYVNCVKTHSAKTLIVSNFVDQLGRQNRVGLSSKFFFCRPSNEVRVVGGLTEPDTDYHNNRAERMLRPSVIARKNSYGSNTPEGAERHCIINSVIETCRLNGFKPIAWLKQALSPGSILPSPFLKQ